MKKIKTIVALVSLSALLGSCSLLDTFFGGGEQPHETTTSEEGSSGSSSSSSSSSSNAVTAITLSQSTLTLGGGDSVQLTVTFTPSTAVNKQVIWETSNSSVATVSSSGVVIGVGIGECDITVKYRSNQSITDTCHVTVTSAYQCSTKTDMQQTYTNYAKYSAYQTGGHICPLTGSPKLLIIPVWFSDSDTYITDETKKANVRADIEKAYLGSDSDTGWKSVKSFYQQESNGTLNLTGTVTDWYTVSKSSTYYANDDDYTSRTRALVTAATDWYFTGHSSDSRANYCHTPNTYELDGVMLIYAAPDYRAAGQSQNNLWAYKYTVGDYGSSAATAAANVFFWASYDFMYGQAQANYRAGSSQHGGDTSHCLIDAHTYIHEMGHVLGLDDYYDYGSTDYCVAGGFSMQDYNVGGHEPFSVMAYGWADPYVPLKSCQMTIGAFQDTHDFILLTPGMNSNYSVFDEYLLLELYTPTGLNAFDSTYQYSGGYPQGPSIPGIRLWHVDARLYNYYNGNVGTNANNNGVILMNNNTCEGERLSELNDGHGEDWDLLKLIRYDQNGTKPLHTTNALSGTDLFTAGKSFTFDSYSSQFAQNSLNSGEDFKWSFTVDSVSLTSATISLVLSN